MIEYFLLTFFANVTFGSRFDSQACQFQLQLGPFKIFSNRVEWVHWPCSRWARKPSQQVESGTCHL